MDELQSILETYKQKKRETRDSSVKRSSSVPHKILNESLDILDLFFDKVLVDYKLSRIEILILMYIYRRVWIKPNLYREHGISPILSYTEMAKMFNIDIDGVYNSLKVLENMGLIETIRSGQYFIRRFFTAEFDELANQTYDDFEV